MPSDSEVEENFATIIDNEVEDDNYLNDEEMQAFESYSKMPPIPNMTEDKWNSLSELQREEIISEYNSRKERDDEIRKLKDKKKRSKRSRGDIQGNEEETGTSKKTKKSSKHESTHYEDDFIASSDSFIDYESEEEYKNKKTSSKKKSSTKKHSSKSDIIDLDDLKAVLFKRSQLVAYLTNPFFDSLVRNSFVLHRETVGTDRMYQIRQIKNVRETPQEYIVDGVRCNKILVLTYGDVEKEFDLNSISNSKLSENDLFNFIEEREHYGMPIMTKIECSKRLEEVKEFETKVPTAKDLVSMIEKRQLTVDVHKINTTRSRGDLVIKKDRLENELKLLQDDLAKSHGRVYDELENHRKEIEKELSAIRDRLEIIDAEEQERIDLMKERDAAILQIAEKHQLKNIELMKNSSKHRKDNYLSRNPTLPSVSWSLKKQEVEKETKKEEKKEVVKEEKKEEVQKVKSLENYHSFDFDIDSIQPIRKEEKPKEMSLQRKRVGLSLAQYFAEYK